MKASFPILLLTLAASAASAQTGAGAAPTVVACQDGLNHLDFAFDGKGGATLTRLEGPEITRFPDLAPRDWRVRLVREDGAPRFHIENARGARLSIDTGLAVGRLTWNEPRGAKADLVCRPATP